jgi:4-amino-4-deoxy-L-arabinose transferase-like glycosyltransferase
MMRPTKQLLMTLLVWIKSHRSMAILSIIVILSAGLASYWVMLVAIYESPDEQLHLDYALNIYSAGRLITAREPLHNWNAAGGLHVYSEYLGEQSAVTTIAFHPDKKAPSGYGTRGYFDDLDRGAPSEMAGGMESKPRTLYGYIVIYPFGYYALLAAWLKVVSLFSTRLTTLFFAARFLSVILLTLSLFLVYGVARELRLSRGRALLITAVVGVFPMTSFVASYVQPDNLAFTLVMLSCYLALLARRKPLNVGLSAMLGISMGLLLVTKVHFYVAVLLPVLGMLASDLLARRRTTPWFTMVLLVLGPSLALGLVQAWVVHGPSAGLAGFDPTRHNPGLQLALSQGKLAAAAFFIQGVGLAFRNFYLTGTTCWTFWGCFGYFDTPLIIFTPAKTLLIRYSIMLLNVLVFGMTVIRLEQVATRLIRLYKKGRGRAAACIAFSNPMLNGYFVFTAIMFVLFCISREAYVSQGRNWFPFIMPIFLAGTYYAPRALSSKSTRRFFAGFIMAGLVAYCVFASYSAIPTIKHRYYPAATTRSSRPYEGQPSASPAPVPRVDLIGRRQ